MPMTEDLSAFFDTDEFATSATWKGTESVKVIFDNAYAEGLDVAGTTPICTAKESDFSGAAEGQSLVIGAVTYSIVGVQPDGTGLVQLVLERS